MIAFLKGEVVGHGLDYIYLEVAGVGYKLLTVDWSPAVTPQTTWWVSEIIREDKFDLYGFLTIEGKNLFELLLSVSGVGPKSALKVLSTGTTDRILGQIAQGNVDYFNSVSGIGKKTAQKIILELKGSLGSLAGGLSGGVDQEVHEALTSLGYNYDQITRIWSEVAGETLEAKVKSALRLLSKR